MKHAIGVVVIRYYRRNSGPEVTRKYKLARYVAMVGKNVSMNPAPLLLGYPMKKRIRPTTKARTSAGISRKFCGSR